MFQFFNVSQKTAVSRPLGTYFAGQRDDQLSHLACQESQALALSAGECVETVDDQQPYSGCQLRLSLQFLQDEPVEALRVGPLDSLQRVLVSGIEGRQFLLSARTTARDGSKLIRQNQRPL